VSENKFKVQASKAKVVVSVFLERGAAINSQRICRN
jgi:hypothetical protein